jgi:hypothetical protein
MAAMLVLLVAAVTPHVRPTDAMAQAAFDRGWSRSSTFARLVRELDRSNVIVYVETALRLPSTIGGQCFLVGQGADGTRFLRIRLNARASAIDLTARLGHELQHTAEVSRTAAMDAVAMARLYRAIGTELDPSVFDTAAARHVEAQVTAEMFARAAPPMITACEWRGRRGSWPFGWMAALLR